MKKSTRILVWGLLAAYVMFAYGQVSVKMSEKNFLNAQLECQRQLYAPKLSRLVMPICTPLALIDLRDQGQYLAPWQHNVIAEADEWLEGRRWRLGSALVALLSLLPRLWEFFAARCPRIARRITDWFDSWS